MEWQKAGKSQGPGRQTDTFSKHTHTRKLKGRIAHRLTGS
jgi:hypothetical protein